MRLTFALLLMLLLATAAFGQSALPDATHLLDSGPTLDASPAVRGGSAPPTGPTPIFYPPASTMAMPAPPGFGFPGAVLGPAVGGLVGNLFLPTTPGYPPSFLTAGAMSGFDVTGAFAWHLAPTPMASIARILGGGAVTAPATTFATSMLGSSFFTVTVSVGTPAPSGLIFAPGAFAPPVRVTGVFTGIFCGLGVGGPGYPPIAAGPSGNGLGGITAAPALPPLRIAPIPLSSGAPVAALAAPPAAYIAGCFADSATTPVELMSYSVD